jgi:hypothetical protein
MEMQQIMELLLARMDTNTKANQNFLERMEAKIYANHKMMMAEMRAWREERKTNRETRKAINSEANPEEKGCEAEQEKCPRKKPQ